MKLNARRNVERLALGGKAVKAGCFEAFRQPTRANSGY